MKSALNRICFVTVVLFLTLTAAAQDILRVDVDLVTVRVTVKDDRGVYVNGLGVEDFAIEENGLIHKIAHFSHDPGSPLSVGILLDAGNSMDRKFGTAIYAISSFVRELQDKDEIFLMTFNDTVEDRQDFTTDRSGLLRILKSIHLTKDAPASLDPLQVAVNKISEARYDSRAVLLLSDNQDAAGYATADGFKIILYASGIRGEPPMKLSEMYVPGKSRELTRFLADIPKELRSQYTLGYYQNTALAPSFRNVRIATHPEYTVHTKTAGGRNSN